MNSNFGRTKEERNEGRNKKLEANFTPQQATKAQRGCRSLTLLFL
jgi:hypothetical protein